MESKQKCAFYNCFVIILRVLIEDSKDPEYGCFHEFHAKIFNTGKVEIPGIRSTYHLETVLSHILIYLRPLVSDSLDYTGKCDTVLINSNFSCNFYIKRENLFEILKTKYKIQCIYDPCSYPGIQCKFYYDNLKDIQTGIREYEQSDKSCNITVISFMIFRTGSILIVGMCDEDVLDVVYKYIRELLEREYVNIHQVLKRNHLLNPKQRKAN